MKSKFMILGGLTASMLALAGCAEGAAGEGDDDDGRFAHLESERGGIGVARQAVVDSPVSIDMRRSLAVTETAIVSQISLTQVLSQLAAQSGVAGLTGTQLWKQLWDTQNPSPGLTNGPHCNDVVVGGQSMLNGFPYGCRPSEGAQANDPAGSIAQYSTIGFFNRFDLAPASGSDCGEYRIVFAKTSGGGRNFVIFEAVLPNPTPELGLDGCRPITRFWRDLSTQNSVSARATALKGFYMQGIAGFLPVVHIDNYGNATARKTGQVRTNQFIQGPWMLREFSLRKTCASAGCKLQFFPASDKTNPFGGLFSSSSSGSQQAAFKSFFATQVEALAVNDINLFNYTVPDSFNTGESVSQAPSVNDYVAQFSAGSAFATSIQGQLNAIGSPLTPTQIVARAEALSCGGCHQLSNGANLGGGLTWPSSAGFVHASEFTESGPEGTRFALSSALTSVFLPHRKQVFEGFVNSPETCMHDVCTEGVRLLSTCDECVTTVCEADNFCCNFEWDSQCVNEAGSLCDADCD